MKIPMLATIIASSALAAALPSHSSSPAEPTSLQGKNLIKNGSFESGGKSLNDWYPIYPRSLATVPPVHQSTDDDAKEGKQAASILVDYKNGYTSWTQTVTLPKKTRSIHLEGWARLDRLSNDGHANLMVTYRTSPDDVEKSKVKYAVRQSGKIEGIADWTQLSLDAPIPEGCTELLVRCGVVGPCAASFDDLVLTASKKPVSVLDLRSAVGDYTAKANVDTDDPRVRMSIPIPIGTQTPLAIRVTSDPPGAVASLSVVRERENRPLEILLNPMSAGDEVALRVETLTMIRSRELSDGEGIRVSRKGKLPKDVAVHMQAADGIEVEHEAIVEASKALKGKDLDSVMQSLRSYLKENLTYEGGQSQGAVDCLSSGKGVCTGYANTAAALLIARGVPARVLACTFPETRLQEHYLVEAWTKELEWSRMESTGGTFPYPDSSSLILRVVYPDSERSSANVPLYRDASVGMTCAYRPDDKTCWQGGHVHKSITMANTAPPETEDAARAAFENLADTPSAGPVWVFANQGDKTPKGTQKLMERIHEWATTPGQLN